MQNSLDGIKLAVLTASVSRSAGGLFWAISSLCNSLQSQGINAQVFGGHDDNTLRDLVSWAGVPVSSFPVVGPSAFGFMPSLLPALKRSHPDILHAHGLWMYTSLASWLFSMKGAPCIISPHGMLDPWAVKNSGIKKKIAGFLYENRHLKRAHCLHALCEAELDAIRDYGLQNPVAVIPNGVDLPDLSGSVGLPAWYARLPVGSKILFFLSRLHPKKGLPNLLDAWSVVRQRNNSEAETWQLVIAGWEQGGHQAELESQVRRLGISGSVHFVGSQFGEEKEASFRAADAFILPSFSEGLPMAVLEAWSYGLPVLMTPQCNLPEGFAANAAIRVEPAVDSLCHGLECLFAMNDAERNCLSNNARQLVENHFTWEKVGQQMAAVYSWVLGYSDKPDFVKLPSC